MLALKINVKKKEGKQPLFSKKYRLLQFPIYYLIGQFLIKGH